MAGIRRRAYRSAPSGPPSPPQQTRPRAGHLDHREPARCTPARADDADLTGFRIRAVCRARPTPNELYLRAACIGSRHPCRPFSTANLRNSSSDPEERQRHIHVYKSGIARLAGARRARVMADRVRPWPLADGTRDLPYAARLDVMSVT